MLVVVDGPPGVYQIGVAAGTVIHYKTPAILHWWERQALRTVDYLLWPSPSDISEFILKGPSPT